jgi:hypothetical protein
MIWRVHCHHEMEHPQTADGGDSQEIRLVTVNILNDHLQTANNWWFIILHC